MSCGCHQDRGSGIFCVIFLVVLVVIAFALGVMAINGYETKTNAVALVVKEQIKTTEKYATLELDFLDKQYKVLKALDDSLSKEIEEGTLQTIKAIKADGWLTRERIKQLDAKDQKFFEAVLKKLDAILCKLED